MHASFGAFGGDFSGSIGIPLRVRSVAQAPFGSHPSSLVCGVRVFLRKWFDPIGPTVPVFLGRVAAFNLSWRGGVARVAAASGPWPSERLSGRPHRGHRFRAVAIGETLRVPTRLLFQEPLPCHRATPVASVAVVSCSRGEGTRATHSRGRLSCATCRRRRRPFRDMPRNTWL